MCFSTRKRTGRVQPKGAQRSPAESVSPSSTKKALLGCFVALCVAVLYALDDGYWDAIMGAAGGRIVESDPKELDSAIEKALGKDRRELGHANRAIKLSFDAQEKEGKTGQVNARAAGHLLENYFAADGWRVQGLSHQAMRPTSVKGLHDALHNVAVLKNLAPGVHDALQRRATSRGGFTLKQITGLAAVIKGKLMNEGQVTTVLRMLYRRHNLSFDSKIHRDTLENVTEAYLSHLNVVDTYAEAVSPALPNSSMADLQSKALEHAFTLATRSSGKLGAGSNFTSPNYSFQVVTVMAENLTRAFERRYIADHCENVGRLLKQAAPKGTGRLRLSTFYSQAWNGTMNFAEPKRHLRLAGALDEADKDQDTTRVLAANYLQGHLNCIRHSQYYSLCCPNQCASIMQSIEASVKAPVATPQEIIDAVANFSSESGEAPREVPTTLVAKLYEIPEKHGGVVPLHGRLFAQWLHYTFPHECRYPQEKDIEMRKVRLTPKEVSTPEKEEIAWATLNKGFDVPPTRLHTAPWSETEVLPLREEQVWSRSSIELRDVCRVAACLLVVFAMVRMMYKFARVSQVDEDSKPASGQSSKNEAFENRLKARVELLRFEYNVELTPGKGQEQMNAGLQFHANADPKDGLVVEEILPGGLMHLKNDAIVGTKRVKTLVGDQLVAVNGKTSPQEMMEELSMLSGKTSLRFSRESSRAAPLIWTADLERTEGEAWGMALSEVAETQNSKELTVSRVVAGGPVDKWNRRATKKGKNGIYPGDIIIGCSPEVDFKKVLGKLQKENVLELTILRWHAATEPKVQPKGVEKIEKVESKSPQNEHAEQPQEDVAEDVQSAPPAEFEEHRCACCDTVITDKFVVMCCNAGEVKYYQRTCWRKKHGGFTVKHLPRRCTCGSPLAKVEVFERSSPKEEPRLIHTILDGPMEVDVRMDDVPEQEDRAGNAQRRGASATRRAVEGDARRRAASTGRRRSSPERRNEQDGDQDGGEVDQPFFRPRRHREVNVVAPSSSEQATSSIEQPESRSDTKVQPSMDQQSQSAKGEVVKLVNSKQAAEPSDKKMQSENSSKRARTPPREPKRLPEEKLCVSAGIKPDLCVIKQQPEKPRQDDMKQEADPWFAGVDPWEAGRGTAEQVASIDKKKDPWFATQEADPWAAAKSKDTSGAKAEQCASTNKHDDPWFATQEADPWAVAKSKDVSGAKAERTGSKERLKKPEKDPWLGFGTDSQEAGKQKHDKEDPWFASPAADPWKPAPQMNQESGKLHQMTSEGDFSDANGCTARSSSRALLPSSGHMNPLAVEFVPGGRSLPPVGLLLPQPPPPLPPPVEFHAPQGIDFVPPPGLLEPPERPLGPAAVANIHCPPPPGLAEPDIIGLENPAPIGLCALAPEPAPVELCDPPPGLAEPTLPNAGFARDVAAPPGLSLVDAPPGLEAPLPRGVPEISDGGLLLPALSVPAGLSAPPGLPEPDAHWSMEDEAAVQGSVDEASTTDASKASKTNRWNKNRQGASE